MVFRALCSWTEASNETVLGRILAQSGVGMHVIQGQGRFLSGGTIVDAAGETTIFVTSHALGLSTCNQAIPNV